MKKLKYITYLFAALLTATCTTACMDDDWSDPDPEGQNAPVGNNDIEETNVITIKQLKENTINKLASSVAFDTIQITQDWQLKVRITGNDVESNIYKEIAVEDESGEAMIIGIDKSGLFSVLPVGQQILVNLKGLYIGMYGRQPQIGTPYTNSSGRTFASRMPYFTWKEHFKVLGNAQPSLVVPEEFDVSKLKDESYVKAHTGKLMTLKNVQMVDGGKLWAPESDVSGGAVSRTVKINGKAQSLMVVRSSSYADFAAATIPSGNINLTGIFTVYNTNADPTRYGYTWQILLRSIDDVEEVK